MLGRRIKPVLNCGLLYRFVPVFISPVTYEIRQTLSFPNSKALNPQTLDS